MFRNKTARQHDFAVSPRAEIPRSIFNMAQTRKQAFDASELIVIQCEEVLPGDVWEHHEAIAARLATPIAPVVDDLDLETWYFFVPNRITNPTWEELITGTNTNAVIPTIRPRVSGSTQILVNSLFDHFGLPLGTYTGDLRINRMPIDAYMTIYNEWFRDQNLQTEITWDEDDPALDSNEYTVFGIAWGSFPLRVNKRPDYFTKSLPFAQKGPAVELPLGTTAPVIGDFSGPNAGQPIFAGASWPGPATQSKMAAVNGSPNIQWAQGNAGSSATITWGSDTSLLADLSAATAATINSLRLAFQTQRLLERDARGGSRYVEQLVSHFGVRSPDYRLQRPEYLGGTKTPITVNPVAASGVLNVADEGNAPVGYLGAEMHASSSRRTFRYAATEHGYIIGLAAARATPTYQQGIRRHWLHDNRLSYYFPAFAHLGEQAVNTIEIYAPADLAPANEVWGYQERWAELRYTPNEITGHLRSTSGTPMDWWHYAEEFTTEPALNDDFMLDKTQEVLARSLAADPDQLWSAQIIMDIKHTSRVARLMPMYSVPGLIDHL